MEMGMGVGEEVVKEEAEEVEEAAMEEGLGRAVVDSLEPGAEGAEDLVMAAGERAGVGPVAAYAGNHKGRYCFSFLYFLKPRAHLAEILQNSTFTTGQ